MAMEFCAVAKEAVQIFTYNPGEKLPEKPDYSFPAVSTAEGCVWSADGNLLGLSDPKTGGVAIYDASDGYKTVSIVPPLIDGSLVRMFYFSPLSNCLVTYERWLKDAGENCGLWDVKTGELKWSFMLKTLTEMNWPPLKWTQLETHCCRMVSDGVQILKGSAARDEPLGKISVPHIMAFEVAPKGTGSGPPHVAVVTPEAKGAPARCSIYSLDEPDKVKAGKSFYKVQKAIMKWNNTGSSLLILTSMETDDTGKAYYGSTNLYFLRADGQEDCCVAAMADGMVHDVQWCPTQDEFLLLHGDLPCKMNLYDGRKANQKMELGSGHRNTIKWNPYGRFVVLGGFGQLAGDVDFWDKTGRKKLGSLRMDTCVTSEFAPDGRHFLGATTAPRMRVDNKIMIFDYCGNSIGVMPFGELRLASWRPRPRGKFEDRPPSPDRKGPAAAGAKTPGGKAAPKPQAYRPPGARGAGGSSLQAMLRSELGSTSADSNNTATKMFGRAGYAPPPGAAPQEEPSGGGGNSRNARRKKAKDSAAGAAEAEQKDKLAAASATIEFEPPSRSGSKDAEPKQEAQASAGPMDNAEVEKKVRALRKKLRDIEKLKEKPSSELEANQREKLKGEADILKQLRDLGAEE